MITAAVDDPPVALRFPRADAAVAAVAPDRSADIADWLAARCGFAASVVPGGGAPPAMTWWRREDGAAFGCGGGTALASALLARDCGGAFEAGGPGGASVARAVRDLGMALRDALVPGGGWAPGGEGPATVHAVTVGGVEDTLAIGIVAAPCRAAMQARETWGQGLNAALSRVVLPLRLVLHEDRVAMRTVRTLGVGDVLPIATAREVALRSGRHRVARGRVIDGETGRIEIVATGDYL
ncbi:FliM/FliN family flagellar motor switch protein [Glacieibacterium frigidum]|uniref:Flagellar motor switch protein FliN-like C-terminal domain-containing protein n=1 Tax=Glacieibacterium frigidum TaxID=2593303 RepID=A0A552U7A2_9SPHN|nr:FliM/FliN family flagellar motor switch protein [Glacieibacterium frigidum]TRW14092.1 hypothetical protein FMM06_10190 [Glacieibacterium frigidum]